MVRNLCIKRNVKNRYMRTFLKTVILLSAIALSAGTMSAQSARSAVFTLNDLSDNSSRESSEGIYMPPNLSVDIDFIDEDGKGILTALEKSKIRLSISNSGGDANGVKVTVSPQKKYPGINMNNNSVVAHIPSQSVAVVEFPLEAGIDLATSRDTKFDIKIEEPLGYDIEAVLNLSTIEYLKSRLVLNGVTSIADAGLGLMARNGNPDGRIQAGDVVSVTVMLQNAGVGTAENVTYSITSKDPNVLLYTSSGPTSTLSGKLSDLVSGQTEELAFRISPTNRYVNNGGYLPVYITLKEDKGLGNLVSKNIPIPFDATPIKPELVSVDGEFDRMIKDLERSSVVSSDGRVNRMAPKPQEIRDIMAVPIGLPIYKDAVAIVIGTEVYADRDIPTAPYSARDAKLMAEYFKTSMGVGHVDLMSDADVTQMRLKSRFDARRGTLQNYIQPGVTDLFVYYSGHGVPVEDENGRADVLLIPYDVPKAFIEDEGFSLNDMYATLSSLNAKSVTVILDACFSGGSRPSDKFRSESVANQKMVMADVSDMEQPWLDNPNFRVFTSSRGDQTSRGRDLSESGLFTYYLACGLQGDADKNADGSVTMAELVDYVSANVSKESGGAQTPQFYGTKDFVLEKIK